MKKESVESSSSEQESSDDDLQFSCTICDKLFTGMKPLRQHQKSRAHIKAIGRRKLQKEIDEDLKNIDDISDNGSLTFENKVFGECQVCKKEFSGPEPYRQHLQSKAHKKKISEKKILEQITENGKIDIEKLEQLTKPGQSSLNQNSDNEDADSTALECKDCEKIFSGVTPLLVHVTSKTHKKIVQQKELIKKLTRETTGSENKDISAIEVTGDVLSCEMCGLSFSGPENAFDHLKSRGHSKILENQKWKKTQKALKNQSKGEMAQAETNLTQNMGEGSEDAKSTEQVEANQREAINLEEKKLGNTKKDTLYGYEQYKNYKKIMENLKSEDHKD